MARSLVLAVAALLAAAGGARFGDRLAPRVPAALLPRAAHRHHYDDLVYDDITAEQEPDDITDEQEPESPAPPPPPPSRTARTQAHRLEMSTEYFAVPERPAAPHSSSPAPPPPPRAILPVAPPASPNTSSPTVPAPPAGLLRSEPWAVPVLALACACMAATGGFEAAVVWGARRSGSPRRHLLLGQTLLAGLFACAATAALYAAAPGRFTCGAVRFGTGVSYVVVFASLLVKCVFLLSLDGGVHLPAGYQGLLLFFAVMIQVVIGAQWVGGWPPRADGGRCAAPLQDVLLSLSYAALLAAGVCGVALRSRGIRDNRREATHIAAAAGAAAAVWVCWTAAALASPERHRDACLAAGLLATCAAVFALMFVPRDRRLAALGRAARWSSDRDEGLSSLDAGGSGYSPSFFHFKPVKYGIVSGPPPLPDRKEAPAQQAG